MKQNPYKSPETESTAQSHRRLRPYVVLNGVLILLLLGLSLIPFILPVINFTNVSTSPNGDPVTYQTTSVTIEWSALGLLMIPVLFVVANIVLFAFRSLVLRRATQA